MRRYTVLLVPDPVDGGYTATVPTLPGCITKGDTLAEALEHARDAIRPYIEDAEAANDAVPAELAPPALVTISV